MEIAGRAALVTGAGIGTGRAIALALAAAGADVVASDVDEAGGRRTAADCGDGARFVPADLTVPDDVHRLVKDAQPVILVNIASTTGLVHEPYQSPEYGAAKAGLIRFTSALAAVDGVRVNCVVPDWVATERVTAQERATTPSPIPLETVADAVLRLIRDDTLAGRVLVLSRGEPPRLQ
jgi:NAD(P)-dependent dehydrogenase (short-subunit alcohol dehydrogenase family)